LKKKQRVITTSSVVSALASSLWDDGLSIDKKDEVYFYASLNRHLLKHKVMRR